MNKKVIFKIIAIIIIALVFIFAWLFISFWNANKDNSGKVNNSDNSTKYPNAREATDWNAPFMKKIEVKFLDKEEKAKMGLADDKMVRLQVLERDTSGKVTAYKKIYTDEDVVQYIYDSSGAGTSTISNVKAATSVSGN